MITTPASAGFGSDESNTFPHIEELKSSGLHVTPEKQVEDRLTGASGVSLKMSKEPTKAG
jgi:hypothetical protein